MRSSDCRSSGRFRSWKSCGMICASDLRAPRFRRASSDYWMNVESEFAESHAEMMYYARSTRDKATFAAELYQSLGNTREAKRLRKEVAHLDRFIASRLRL